jgi:hypothetical protein
MELRGPYGLAAHHTFTNLDVPRGPKSVLAGGVNMEGGVLLGGTAEGDRGAGTVAGGAAARWPLEPSAHGGPAGGRGLTGLSAVTGQAVSSPDVMNDVRFDCKIDGLPPTGTTPQTHSVLCVPIFRASSAHRNTVMGVLQLVNKKDSTFGSMDEQVGFLLVG